MDSRKRRTGWQHHCHLAGSRNLKMATRQLLIDPESEMVLRGRVINPPRSWPRLSFRPHTCIGFPVNKSTICIYEPPTGIFTAMVQCSTAKLTSFLVNEFIRNIIYLPWPVPFDLHSILIQVIDVVEGDHFLHRPFHFIKVLPRFLTQETAQVIWEPFNICLRQVKEINSIGTSWTFPLEAPSR